jgi:uncharacterized membrane protein YjjP (DUF1212 family)
MTQAAASGRSIELVLKLGRGLHASGYPAHRLEDALERVARRLGLEAQFFSMPTALFASFGGVPEQLSNVVAPPRRPPGGGLGGAPSSS